ncbi:MAG TPA: hypothetical protein VFS00_05500 [Polyangiaceae bacterium]|nr:hypothetical protein [Polyangiaceae bacterium]
MAGSDRAFHALASHEPQVVIEALRLLVPALLPPGDAVTRASLAPTRLDALAPPRDVDSALRVGKRWLVHTECQGYRDANFPRRVFWYHLELAVAHRPRRVRTVSLWLTRGPARQRRERLRHGDVRVRVRHVLLPDVPARTLLAGASTACFAAAADPGARSVAWLCRQVAARLRASEASYYQRHMAVVCAATQGRYDAMVKAMANAGLEPVIIEDLVRFGEDRGLEKGLQRGLKKGLQKGMARGLARGLRAAVADLCEAFAIELTAARLAELEAMDVESLEALRSALKQTKRWPAPAAARAAKATRPAAGKAVPKAGAKKR